LLEDFCALAQRLLACGQLGVAFVEGAPLAFELDAIALERPRLRVEPRQMRLQPFLIVAAIAACGRFVWSLRCPRAAAITEGGIPSRCAISIARLRPGAP